MGYENEQILLGQIHEIFGEAAAPIARPEKPAAVETPDSIWRQRRVELGNRFLGLSFTPSTYEQIMAEREKRR